MDVESLVWSAARRLKQGFEWLYTSVDVLIPYFILGTLTSTLQYHGIPGSYTLSILSSASHIKACAYCNPWLAGPMSVLETRPSACSPPQAKQSPLTFSLLIISIIISSKIGHHYHHYHCSPSLMQILQHSYFHNFEYCYIKKDNFHMFCILVAH